MTANPTEYQEVTEPGTGATLWLMTSAIWRYT